MIQAGSARKVVSGSGLSAETSSGGDGGGDLWEVPVSLPVVSIVPSCLISAFWRSVTSGICGSASDLIFRPSDAVVSASSGSVGTYRWISGRVPLSGSAFRCRASSTEGTASGGLLSADSCRARRSKASLISSSVAASFGSLSSALAISFTVRTICWAARDNCVAAFRSLPSPYPQLAALLMKANVHPASASALFRSLFPPLPSPSPVFRNAARMFPVSRAIAACVFFCPSASGNALLRASNPDTGEIT